MIIQRVPVLLVWIWAAALGAQNWATVGGNNLRNGYSPMPGPDTLGVPAWSVTSPRYTAWGNSILVHGDRFVQSRVQISPSYVGQVECRSLTDGSLLWTATRPGGKLYAVGFDDYAVYVHNYADKAFLALDPADGSQRWQHLEPVEMFGGTAGILFACDGDPVVVGKRIDRYTGATVWATDYVIPVSPDAGYTAYGDTYYHWEGSILTPKRLIALDMETGGLKYKSDPLPGDGDQEWPLSTGPDGTVYITRDGGKLHAFEDTGTGFLEKWNSDAAPESRIAFGPDGSLYYYRAQKILRASPVTGAVLDTSGVSISTSYQPLITVDPDGRVYVNSSGFANLGKYFCLSSDLQTVRWQINTPTNYYAGIAPGREGTAVICGEGYQIKAYRYKKAHRPVADFSAGKTFLSPGEPLDLTDRSSFAPTSWQWYFPGAVTPFSSEQNPAGILYPSEGIYEVTLIAGNDLGADTLVRSCYIHVGSMVDSEAPELWEPGLKIYPQPASDHLSVEVPLATRGWRLLFRSMLGGATVFETVLSGGTEQIPLAAWPAGAYVAEIISPAGKRYMKKMVIVR